MLKIEYFKKYLMIFTLFYIAAILILQYNMSYMSEKTFKIPIPSKKEQRLASSVETGMSINNFSKFSFTKNQFTMDAVVWFKFPVGTESIETIEKFSFKNGKVLSKSEPVVQIIDNFAIVSYQVLTEFSTPLSYKYFPASDHKLTIIMQNKTVGPAELQFTAENFNLEFSKNLGTGNWQPGDHYVQSGYVKTSFKDQKDPILNDFPAVVYSIDFLNRDLRHFIILYLPLLLIFLLIFISLLAKVEETSLRLPMVAAVIPILALHSLVIESISPTGSDITKIDLTYFTLILLAIIILIFQSYIGLSVKSFEGMPQEIADRRKKRLIIFNNFVIISVLMALIISFTYSTFT